MYFFLDRMNSYGYEDIINTNLMPQFEEFL